VRNSTALQGEHDNDTTAHIHFALCVLKLDGAGATMSALQGEHDDDTTAHIHFALCAWIDGAGATI
jgi:hypothetical protein